jgi:NADP-reducing hydrogenase subunit HndB
MKLKPEDLDKISEKMKSVTNLREGAGKVKVTVHMGTCGIASGSRKILSGFLAQLDKTGSDDIIVTTSGCAGLCSREPMATVELKGEPPVKYVDLTEDKVKKIFEEHVIGGKIVSEYALAIGSERIS